MIAYSIFYPYGENTHFDVDYYCHKHLGIIKKYFGDKCKGILVVEGGQEDEKEPRYSCVCHIFFNSKEEFNDIMKKARPELLADVKNYTNITPTSKIYNVAMNE